jgi:stage V sporulation protein K
MNPSEGTEPTPTPREQRDEIAPSLPPAPPVTETELADLLANGKVAEFNERRGRGPYKFQGLKFKGLDLQGVILDFCEFENCEFRSCSLTKASLLKATFLKTLIQDSNLDGLGGEKSKFQQCTIIRSPFRNSELGSSQFSQTKFSWANFAGSRMDDATLERCIILNGDFEKINAPKLAVLQCRMEGVTFAGAHLKEAHFIQINTVDAKFQAAHLIGCRFGGSWFEGAFSAEGAFISSGALTSSMFPSVTWDSGAVLNSVNVNQPPVPGVFESLAPEKVTVKELINGMPGTDKELYEGALARLSALVGLDEVKNEVQELAAVLRVNRQREAMGLSTHTGTLHYVFSGPPGTGKTTVARILGDVLKSLGYLSKGHFVETDRAGLVGRYLGETAVKTKAAVEKAIGGVLFIDEAYALTPDEQQDIYAQEAVSTLLKIMEDKRTDLVVIAAGYDSEMERFIKYNPGLQSRFANRMKFRSLDAKSLTEVFVDLMNTSSYVTDQDTLTALSQMFGMIREKQGGEFGNARAVRNVFDKMIRLQSARLVKEAGEPDITRFNTLTFEDLPTKEFLNITVERFRQMVDKDQALPYEADLGVFIDPKLGFKGYHFPN